MQADLRRGIALAAALAVAAAGCSAAGGPAEQARPMTQLTIVLDRDGNGPRPAREAHVTCPADSAACRVLEHIDAQSLAPVPRDRACTMIYGGPQHAALRGRLHGEPVAARFRRTNGCEIARYQRIAPLLDVLF